MYLVGGTMNGRDYNCNQMYRLDLQTFNWDMVATRASEGQPTSLPVCIDEHTAILDGNTVIIFGGFQDGCRTNMVHTFDAETRVWSLLEPANPRAPAPSERAGHAAVFLDGNLYVFGGKDDDNQKLNDLWRFNLSERTWTKLTVDQDHTVPMARSGHSANLYEGYMCVFGGIFEVTKELNDLHLYDIANNRWICLFAEKTEFVTAQSPTKTMAMGSVSPLLRRGTKTGSEQSPNGKGGTSGDTKTSCSYRSAICSAMQSNFGAEPGKKKCKHSGEESKKPHKEVRLDSPTSTDMQRSLLIANADHSFDHMAQLKRKKNNFGFGGTIHNTFGLNMSLSQKGKLRVCGIRPNPRDGHTSVIHEGKMIVFGGDRHHMPFNDMFVLDVINEFERQSFQFVRESPSQDDIASQSQVPPAQEAIDQS